MRSPRRDLPATHPSTSRSRSARAACAAKHSTAAIGKALGLGGRGHGLGWRQEPCGRSGGAPVRSCAQAWRESGHGQTFSAMPDETHRPDAAAHAGPGKTVTDELRTLCVELSNRLWAVHRADDTGPRLIFPTGAAGSFVSASKSRGSCSASSSNTRRGSTRSSPQRSRPTSSWATRR